MKPGLLIILLLWSGLAAAQSRSGLRLDFQFSRVVLTNGDTLAGPVAVHFNPDLLCLAQPDGTVRTLAPAVAAFAVQGERIATGQGRRLAANYDPTLVRLFRTLQWPLAHPGEQRAEPAFFEQLSEGPVLLVRRQQLTSHTMAQLIPAGGVNRGMVFAPVRPLASNLSSVNYTTVTEMQDEYFLVWPTGELIPLLKPKKDLLAAFANQAVQLQAYAKSRGLSFTSTRELQELVSYANSLQVLATQP